MRRPVKNRNIAGPDLVYKHEKIGKMINYLMLSGKKNTARSVAYDCFDLIKETAKVENPIEIFEKALENASPLMEVRSRRVGGANYQVPREVRPERRLALGMKWIIEAARGKKGKPMAEKLAEEIIAASKNEGEAVRKRENTHKMADANKAFAHFAW
ncbi:MAG: 30S ribosomal protein S7 [bacterium]|nr:30S ribosomal protein S7 [bacterium]